MFTDTEAMFFGENIRLRRTYNQDVSYLQQRLSDSIEIGNKNYRIANDLEKKIKEKESSLKSKNEEIQNLKAQIKTLTDANFEMKKMIDLCYVKVASLHKTIALYENYVPENVVDAVAEKACEFISVKLKEKNLHNDNTYKFCAAHFKNIPDFGGATR